MCLSFLEYEISNVRLYYDFHTKINMKLQNISLCQFRENMKTFIAGIKSFEVHIQKT
jgi:hypothetical protein